MKSDEDAPCDICRSKESEPSNEMVFCDVCDVCVHQACYGVQEIPEGPWFCKPCEQNIRPKCIFCPSKKGAMKKTKNGNWAHVSCALWIPEVSFGDPERMDNIVNIEKIPKNRWGLTCSLCHARGGACIQCYVKKCRTAYHVTCAFDNKLRMEMEDIEDGDQEIKFESFCLLHTNLHASGQNPHADGEPSRKRKRVQENLESNENNIANQVPRTKAPLEEENRASTSHDTGIPVVSVAEDSIEKNGNNVQNVNGSSRTGAGLLTEQDIKNLASISKGTARKSFAPPPKKSLTLSQILPKLNGKMPRNDQGQFSDKSKRSSVQNRLSTSKKSKTKSSTQKTKSLKQPNPSTQIAPHEEGENTTQSQQPASSEPQFSGTPCKSSPSMNDIRQLFPTPTRQTSAAEQNNVAGTPQSLTNSNSIEQSSSASHVQQSSMSPNEQQVLSDIARSFTANPTSSTVSKNDNFDEFSRYIISLLRALPFKKTLRVQKKIISLVLETIEGSSDEEDDALSLSSDE